MKAAGEIGKIILTAAILWLTTALYGQTGNNIFSVALIRNDSIVLRWAPSTVPAWQAGAKYGYVITRYTVAKNGHYVDNGLRNGTVLTASPIRPFSEDSLTKISLQHEEASVIQEVLYGNPVQHGLNDFESFMKSYEENEMKLGFALFICDMYPVLAKAAGLQFVDHNIVPGERYAYIIAPAFLPEGLEVEPGIAIADAGIPTKLPPVIDISALFNDRIVRLRWPIIHHKGIYSAYLPEKSFDGKNFEPVTDLPLVNFSEDENQEYFIFTDSLRDNDSRVWYRIIGVSPFGIKGPPSEIISGKGIADFSAYAVIDTAWVEENKNVVIQWRTSENQDSPVNGINILRSGDFNGNPIIINKRLLPAAQRSFTDHNPEQSNYYQVMLTGEGDLRSLSFPYFVQTQDNDPPLPPEILSGKIDSAGYVTILWKKNAEPDLLGYKIFRANSDRDEFVALESGISPFNICHDSVNLNTLAGNVYYQVVAIDKNYNSSEYSNILELTRPDTIAPAPAIITRIIYSDEKVEISFEASPSQDVAYYELLGFTEKDTVPRKIFQWNSTLPQGYNHNPETTEGYEDYILATYDHSGNRADNMRRVFVRSASSTKLEISAELSKDGKTVILGWETPAGFTTAKTFIYRGQDTGPPSLYKTVEGDTSFFIDKDIELNTSYFYRVAVYEANGKDFISSGRIDLQSSFKD